MKKILTILLVAFIIIQFFPIDKTNPPVNEGMDFLKIKNTPENITKLISNSCYDCHSNETRYPWYSNIAPSSWFLKNHIDEGRQNLNFSTFAMYEPKRQIHKMEECIEMIETAEMPLESYYIGHQDAKLTDQQRKELVVYFKKQIEDTKIKMQ
ncbi:heme-binding domain-containing protein [Chryseobacterium wangxinyae]|uniref:heme-binding domain-containing protein n=1 Tax=unclassified Chryseobacterium TaxID=2593645 RepID=UPI002270AEAC|nr:MULTISPECIES: heme-binding domain-containing protein [unclassified Chryseobacterium]MCY0968678.1 heme-binding domain-containing protein [Chryseobacterium sp. CY353]MCY0979040.1 heme-binding domain-containing protein [Chryseobacterium sp. CY350]WBZ97233.1 heme-binding domain-containing protein [Chryseobacterium sp. CY350]